MPYIAAFLTNLRGSNVDPSLEAMLPPTTVDALQRPLPRGLSSGALTALAFAA